MIEKVHQQVDPARLYAVDGLQVMPINTVYQLAAEPDLQHAARALMIPDLLGYWLTGREVAEETNASTTGLLDARTGRWAPELVEALGLPAGLLPEIVEAGAAARAGVSRGARRAGPRPGPLLVTTVGSHDTASAVVGVPAAGPHFGYVSCGTWGLVGVELDAPVLTEDSRRANFTNERGVDGTIRYLRNVMGLWLLSESIRWWNLRGDRRRPRGGPRRRRCAARGRARRFDPDDPAFLPPGDMPEPDRAGLPGTGRAAARASTRRWWSAAILDSLATAFADTLDRGRAALRATPWRSCTSSAADRRTPCSAS